MCQSSGSGGLSAPLHVYGTLYHLMATTALVINLFAEVYTYCHIWMLYSYSANEVCADLEMNSTVKLDANAISYVNETKQYGGESIV